MDSQNGLPNPLLTELQPHPLVQPNIFTVDSQKQQPTALFSVDEQLIEKTIETANSWKVVTEPFPIGTVPNSFGEGVVNSWLTSANTPNPVTISDPALLTSLFPKSPTSAPISIAQYPAATIGLSKDLAISQIQTFLNRPDRLEQFKIAFGQDVERSTIDKIIGDWQKQNSKLPDIEILSAQILGKADGGFDTVNNKIYLARNLIERGNLAEIVPVIIEEFGHYLDSKIHPGGDAVGDEGEIFSKLVRGISISPSEYVTLVNEDDHATIILNQTPTVIEQAVTTNYAIKAEKTVSFNGSSDLDGNPLDLSDDALVYGGKGFTFNGNSILPVKYDASGNPLKNSQGKLVLVDNAVTVTAGYLQANVNGTGSKYAGLIPPQIVTAETIIVPLFADIKQQELNRKIPAGTATTTFNISTNPINTAAQWATKFPPAGTATVPKVVRVTGGGLNIPGTVNLSNYVIIVDSGDINFNGTGNLSNVTLVASNGNINLNAIQSDNLSALASGTINHNSSARFGGNSLFANGTGNITFNGATKGITANDNLWVISAGNITFNGSQSTRGSFVAQGDFIANGSTDLHGTVSSKQNIIFNGSLNFTYVNIRNYSDSNPPVILANLVTDSGTSNSDKITNDSRISGTVTDASQITSFKAGFDSKPLANFIDVLPYLTNGSFSFTKAQLETIYGGTIPDGSHTLNLIATDQYGNQSSVYPYTFTLDTTTPVPTLNLAAASDTGVVGDYRTKSSLVTLTGKVEANARVLLSGNPTPVTADSAGNYTFTNVALAAGNNSFTVTATDIAGNQKAFTQIVYRTSPPTGVSLGTPQILENSANNTQIGGLGTTDPDGVDNYVYTLVNDAGGRFKLVGDKIQVANGSLLDFEANTLHQIQVRTTDGEGDSYLQTIAISVLNVNESPNNLLVLPTVILENSPNNTIVGTITSTDPDAGDNFNYSLVAGTGDGDNAKFSISGDKLVIKNSPDYEAQSSYTIRLKTTDAGGLSYQKQVTISVTNVNEAPISLTLSNNTVAENSGVNGIIGTFTSTDPDLGDTKTYTLTNGVGDLDNSQFTIVGDKLQLNPNPNFEAKSSYQLRMKVTDAGGLSYQQAFVVNINDVNEAPTNLTIDKSNIDENSLANSVVGNLTTTDPDSIDTASYTLVAGTGDVDNSKFAISGNKLQIKQSPDFETQSSYSIRIRTTDKGGLSLDKVLTVSVNNLNEAPTSLTLSNNTVAENIGINGIVGTFTSTDPDLGDTKTYALTSGLGDSDNSQFTIVGDKLQLKPNPDFETKSSYQLRARVTDAGGLSYDRSFIVNISDVNEAPTALNISNTTLAENVPGGSVVGNLSSLDPDTSDNQTFSLVAGTGDINNSAFSIVGTQLVINNSPNFEAQNNYSLRVRVSDRGGLTFDRVLNVNITDVNEAPTAINLSGNTIAENSSDNSIIGILTTLDPDAIDTASYTLTDNANGRFKLVGNELKVASGSLLDFEANTQHQITISSTDKGGLTLSRQFTIGVTNVNEIPIDLSLSNSTVAENTPSGSVIGNLNTIDPDLGDTHTYTLVNGTGSGDNSAFSIVNNQLKFLVSPNFETKSNYSLRVRTTDAGGLNIEKALTVNVTNINEAPTQLVLDTTSVAENSPLGTLVGKFATTDPDLGDTHTYSLITGNGSGDNSKFSIVSNELRLNISPDFETQSIYRLRVQTADAGGLTWIQELTVGITDVNESVPITLVEGTSFNKHLDIPITIPTTGGKLSFKLNPLQFDGADLTGINDALEVALVDAQGKSVVTPFQTGRDAFFNWTEGEPVATGKGASYDPATGIITLDLTGVKPGAANLIFRLINNDTDTTTSVTVTDITLAPIASTPALANSNTPTLPSTPKPVALTFFNSATDVSASIGTDYHRTSFNATTKELDVNVALKNQGSYGLNGTLVVVVNHISDPSVQVKNADGFTPEGLAYYTFTTVNGKLDPNSVTGEKTLVFRNPNGVQFSYDLTVLAELNAAPVIKSQPELEVIGGKNYQYQVKAEDVNGDSLTYKLLSAPSGMAIDPSTGLVSWNTSVGAVGNYQLSVEVSDGRGGIAQQNYNLAVITPPPNRPPVFTSIPVVDTAIGSVYSYQGIAKDPDGDSLIYNLTSAPVGMTVNANTGVLTWNPTGSQLGTFDVSLGVADNRGGVAQQQFKIRTGAAVWNHAPLIVSDAVILATAGKPYSYQVKAVDPDPDLLVYSLNQAPQGMTINSQTGLINWNPASVANTPILVSVKVQDNLGGSDTQNFELNPIYASLGKISGQVYVDDGRANSQVVYFNDFENPNRSLNEWSSQIKDTSPIGGQHFLGQFGGYAYGSSPNSLNNSKLSLANLPEHDSITIDLDLYIINSWDGSGWNSYRNPGWWNPDWLDLSVVNGPKLLHATFAGGSYPDARTQSYPDPYLGNDYSLSPNPGNLNYAGTGATTRNTLGYNYGGDSTYHLSFTLDHSNSDIIFSWLGGTDEGLGNESWGIDNVKVSAGRKLTGIGNQKVFIDANANNKLDNAEIFTTTNEQGKYSFDLAPGNYRVATDLPLSWQQTSPIVNYQVDLTNSQQVTNRDFGLLAGGNIGTNEVAPKFLSTPIKNATVEREYRYAAFARDDNFDRLTYDLVTKPDGMIIDTKTGIISWLPSNSQIGKYDVVVRGSDGRGGVDLQAFSINVDAPNSAPVLINSQPGSLNNTLIFANDLVQVGAIYKFQFKGLDPDGDLITYKLASATSQAGTPTNLIGASIDNQTGLFSWNTNNLTLYASTLANVYSFTIEASDGRGGIDFQTFALELTNNSGTPNLAPVIVSTPRKQTAIGQTYVYQIAATDPNSDPLTYSLINPPAGMSVNTKGLLTWTPTAAQLGQSAVQIQVSDGRGGVTTQQFGLDVVSAGSIVNHSPEITSTPTFTTNLGKTYSYQPVGTDSDNDTLIWSLDNAPTGMVIDSNTGIVKWNPTSNQIGTHNIAVRLTDVYGLYVGQEYTLKVNGVNIPPQIQSSPNTIGGLNSPYKYQVKAVDAEGDAIQYSLGRRPTGMIVNSNTGLITWTPNTTQLGTQIIDVLVTDAQGAVTTQTYSLVVGTTPINQAPTITSTPKFTADINTKYQYQIVATDPENSQITYALTTAPAGMVIDTNTGLITWDNPTLGTTNIQITATDTSGAVAAQGYTLTGKQNQPPVINSTPVTQVTLGNTYRYDVIAKDPDNDALTYRLDTAATTAGVSIDKLGRMTWKPTTPNIGIQPVTITVTDASGAAVTQTYNLQVLADNTLPTINLVRGTNIANIGETISFQVQATDNVEIKSKQLLIDNQAVTLDSNGVGTYKVTTAGIVTATAIVTDINGNTSTANSTINIIDPTDIQAPTVKLDLSGIANGIITGRTDIIGTVTDTNLDYYTLEVARFGTNNWQEVFRGTNSITNGSLGKFDPSLLENDSYQIKLTAYDTSGYISTIENEIEVTGDLKLGNFRLSFTDLTVPVTGIPISLTRTYDSLTAGTTDDFGYGWRMEFRDTDLRTSLKADPYYEQLDYRTVGFNFGTRIYITLPGGKREGFTFEPKQVQGDFGGITGGRLYYPSFVSDKGVTSTLTVPGAEIKTNTNKYSNNAGEFSGNPNGVLLYKEGKLFNLAGRPYVPQDDGFGNRYILTTKDGTKYEINATTGDLESVTDTNGNVLTYSDTEIKSSTGVKVTFERDNQGRIISVTDPLEQKVLYGYDAKGDLVSVKDRDGNTTGFQYNATRSHYLDKIVDPLGREAVKTEYDEAGRLKKTANSSGNGVEFVYNPNNSLETVKDALGNATTYEYDKRGNVVTEVDAVGKVTKRTYDDDNNMLSQTVISDRSGVAGFTTTYTYDNQRNKLSETDALGNTTYYTYGEKGRLLTTTDALGRTTTNAYDGNGNLISTKDTIGNITTFTYDGKGQVTQTTDAQGNTNLVQYDSNGNVLKMVDSLGYAVDYTYNSRGDKLSGSKLVTTASGLQTSTTTWAYDTNGRITSMTDALGKTTTYEYDKLGKQTAVTDALGRKTQYHYDETGRLVETIYADDTPNDLTDNSRTKTEYDANSRVIAAIDKSGRISRTLYDAVGRVIESIAPDSTPNDLTDNPRTKTEYYSDGKIKATIDERGNRTEYRYDAAGRQTDVIYADSTPLDLTDNPKTHYQYNQAGQQISVTDALNHTTRYQYDNLGRAVKIIYADDTFTATTYDSLGRRLTASDKNGIITEYRYDAVGKFTGVKNALGDWTNYAYTQEGSLLSITDTNNHSTSYEYDLLGRRAATILPLNQRSTTSYNAVGNVSTMTDFNGKTTIYKYDAQNRLVEQDFTNDPTVTMTYTVDGQIATITDGRGVTSFSYDVQNRLISKTDVDGSKISYTYDLAGNRTSVTTQVLAGNYNTTYYTFDERNRLEKVLSGGVVLTDYDYDGMSNLIKTTLSNGVIETRQYDKLNHLLNLQTNKGNNILTNFVYTLDKIGNRQQVIETVGSNTRTVGYIYDDLYRLTKEQVTDGVNGNRTTEFVYDKVGNRQQQQVTANNVVTATTYQYDANDRLLKEQVNGNDKVIYTYDNNGNTLTKTEESKTTESIWNDQNRLVGVKVKDNAGVVTQQMGYEYDASGIRVSQNVDGEITKYLIDANLPYAQAVVEYRPSGLAVVSYTHGNDLISQTRDGVSSFYHVDGLGSTRGLSDAGGSLIDTYSYQAFGELLNSSGGSENKYLFAGEQFDSVLGDYYNRARYYDPGTGRFTKRDDYEGQIEDPISLHKYLYANGNPISNIDPSGLFSIQEQLAALAILNILFDASAPFIYTPLSVSESEEPTSGDYLIINSYQENVGHTNLEIDNLIYNQNGRSDDSRVLPLHLGTPSNNLTGGYGWFDYQIPRDSWIYQESGSGKIERYSIALNHNDKIGVLNSLQETFDHSLQFPAFEDPNHYRLRYYNAFINLPGFGNNCTNTAFNNLPSQARNTLLSNNLFAMISPHHMAVSLRIASLSSTSGIKKLKNIN